MTPREFARKRRETCIIAFCPAQVEHVVPALDQIVVTHPLPEGFDKDGAGLLSPAA